MNEWIADAVFNPHLSGLPAKEVLNVKWKMLHRTDVIQHVAVV